LIARSGKFCANDVPALTASINAARTSFFIASSAFPAAEA